MGRSPSCEKPHLNKGAWTRYEDEHLGAYIRANGEGHWKTIPIAAGLLRSGKSCRLRWLNYLRPDLKHGNFTPQEDELIIQLHGHFGNKWSRIASRLPGRTDNEIKNYWNSHIRKKLLTRGYDTSTKKSITELIKECVIASISELSKEEDARLGSEMGNSNDKEVNLELSLSPPFQH